jgi:hypothetical protein
MAGRFLSLKQIAEVKESEARCNAIQKREGTKHPMVAIVWSCGCCHGYCIMRHRTIADITVQEEEYKRGLSKCE